MQFFVISHMKIPKWYLSLTVLLVVLSAGIYALQLAVFHNPRDTFFYMLQDLAFVPIQVLLVTLILSDLMARREKRLLLQKMNMVIGAFFSEVGSALLKQLAAHDRRLPEIRQDLLLAVGWDKARFRTARETVRRAGQTIDSREVDLGCLKAFLMEKRPFLMGLLENQNLLEHETFTDLLWATTHLTEELAFRQMLTGLPEPDLNHLSGDIRRVYGLLVIEWLRYVEHLSIAYPYIYSLTVRTNPFDLDAEVTLR